MAILLVTGIGTEVGKTHLAEALLRAWSTESPRVIGFKPIESGVTEGVVTDQDRLDRASTFHVKHPRLELRDPISPHLAARREGRSLMLDAWRAHVEDLAANANVIVELAGGSFTPIDDARTNADLMQLWPGARRLLVGVDRLGILHDVLAATRALEAEAPPLRPHAVALHAPAVADASTGTNAAELERMLRLPVRVVPRGNSADPATIEAAMQCLRSVL